MLTHYLNLLASRSDSSNVRMSPSRTGPLTLRIILRLVSSKNSTRTYTQQHIIRTTPLMQEIISQWNLISPAYTALVILFAPTLWLPK